MVLETLTVAFITGLGKKAASRLGGDAGDILLDAAKSFGKPSFIGRLFGRSSSQNALRAIEDDDAFHTWFDVEGRITVAYNIAQLFSVKRFNFNIFPMVQIVPFELGLLAIEYYTLWTINGRGDLTRAQRILFASATAVAFEERMRKVTIRHPEQLTKSVHAIGVNSGGWVTKIDEELVLLDTVSEQDLRTRDQRSRATTAADAAKAKAGGMGQQDRIEWNDQNIQLRDELKFKIAELRALRDT